MGEDIRVFVKSEKVAKLFKDALDQEYGYQNKSYNLDPRYKFGEFVDWVIDFERYSTRWSNLKEVLSDIEYNQHYVYGTSLNHRLKEIQASGELKERWFVNKFVGMFNGIFNDTDVVIVGDYMTRLGMKKILGIGRYTDITEFYAFIHDTVLFSFPHYKEVVFSREYTDDLDALAERSAQKRESRSVARKSEAELAFRIMNGEEYTIMSYQEAEALLSGKTVCRYCGLEIVDIRVEGGFQFEPPVQMGSMWIAASGGSPMFCDKNLAGHEPLRVEKK